MSMERPDNFNILVLKCLSGEASEKEKDEVRRALELDPLLKKEYLDVREIWFATTMSVHNHEQFNTEAAIRRFKNEIKLLREANQIKKKKNSIKKYYAIVAAAASIAIIFTFLNLFTFRDNSIVPKVVVIHNPRGDQSEIILPDGSKVWLNGSSTLKYYTDFGLQNRKLTLEGEAFFDVQKDKLLPFDVVSGNHHVEVLGTKFNVKAFPDESFIETILQEGSVRIYAQSMKVPSIVLSSGQKVIYNKRNNKFSQIMVGDIIEELSWKDGVLKFKDEPLIELVNELERWFDVEIEIEDKEIESYRFTGTIKNEGVEDLLLLFKMTKGIQYKKEGDKIKLFRKK
ncbi:DUF4974 domain-containing protein [Marinilabiliaceae bacterium JC017]|nr:DUF4974 domain-containing protein [Marinilabiliaceae bacterium JC017]